MKRYSAYIVGLVAFVVFLVFQARGIVAGDSGDLVTAAYLMGVPHPPGYPLYTLLGWLVSRLPVETVAWRLTLLSSLPHALTLVLVYTLSARMAKNAVAGLFAASTLAANYLFFLYSVTPEVFALFDLFVAGLAYVAYRFWERPTKQYLLIGACFVGASFSHHHVILFFLPALAWLVYPKVRALLAGSRYLWSKTLFSLSVGFLPYVYIPVAATFDAIINWNRATNWTQFIRLVTRADYGTFVSGGVFGQLSVQRFLQIKAYGQFLLLDWTLVGLFLSCVGLVFLVRKIPRIGIFYVLALLSVGPIFFFYASFPIVNRFTLGTYERFLLPSYVLLAPLTGVGVVVFVRTLARFVPVASGFLRTRMLFSLTIGVFFLYPLSMAAVTGTKFQGLRFDTTAQTLGQDILASVPQTALLILYKDTPLFITQYVRYALGVRPDVVVLHGNRLTTEEYFVTIKRRFPQLAVSTSRTLPLTDFIEANRGAVPIYANMPIAGKSEWVWIPTGLVYRLSTQNDLPSVEEIITINSALWQSYQDPTTGILSRFDHLMLSDIRDVYAEGRIVFGKMLLRANKVDYAREQFQEAIVLGADALLPDAYTYEGIAALFAHDCQGALRAFASARKTSLVAESSLTLYEGITYRDCVNDEKKAQELLEAYETLKKARETKLQ